MNVYTDGNGTIIDIAPSEVYQGSNQASSIYLTAPFAAQNAITVAFILPSGIYTEAYPMAFDGALSGVQTADGKVFNVWSIDVLNTITQQAGLVRVQFYVYATTAPNLPQKIIATASTQFTVAEGVLPIPPSTPSQDSWELILQYMERAFVAADDVVAAVSPIQIRTQAVALESTDVAYTNLQLIYDGVLIKEWNSSAQTWTQVSPSPTEPEASKWIYNFIFGLPKGDKGDNGKDGINATVQWGVNAPSPISTLQWIKI